MEPQKLKIEFPYDPAIPLLGTHSKELKAESQSDICTPMYIALFTMSKPWKQSKCPLIDEWISKSGIYRQWNTIQP